MTDFNKVLEIKRRFEREVADSYGFMKTNLANLGAVPIDVTVDHEVLYKTPFTPVDSVLVSVKVAVQVKGDDNQVVELS